MRNAMFQPDDVPDFCIWPDSIVRTKMLVQVWQASLRKPIKVLDVGCGRAALWHHFLQYSSNVTVYGFDPSAASIEFATAHSTSPDLSVVQGDVRNIDSLFTEEGLFDIVLSHSVLEHVYPRRKFLEGVSNRLAPAGTLLLSWGSDHFKQGWRTDVRNLISQVLAKFGVEQYYAKPVDESDVMSYLKQRDFRVSEFSFHSIVPVKKCVKKIENAEERRRCYALWQSLEDELNRSVSSKLLLTTMDEAFVIAQKS